MSFFKRGSGNRIALPNMRPMQDAITKVARQSGSFKIPMTIRLGNPGGNPISNDSLYLAGDPNYIYYTTEGEEAAGINFISKSVIPAEYRTWGRSVRIRKTAAGLEFVGLAPVANESFDVGTDGAHTQTAVSPSQFDFASLQPYVGTMFAVVKGAIY